ncbi:MAG: aminotransferase class I/II-fold pyridoxal phosphate-dependent enzyme [bacterium]
MTEIDESSYLQSIGGYAFAEVDEAYDQAVETHGAEYMIDFGVGDPTDPTPPPAREAAAVEALTNPSQGYPSYVGQDDFRQAVSDWYSRRFGVELDPETEITATLGSKQAVFCMPMAFVDETDAVLIPDPGYPPYTSGTKQRGAEPVFMPLKPENDFLPDLDAIDPEDASKAKIMWLNSPNNPTTKIIPENFYREAVQFCQEHNILLCSDEAYSEMYYDAEPPSSLFQVEGGRETGLVVHSLSKRSNMTNYRIGFVAGRPEHLDKFKRVQTNMHSGQAQILQKAAVGAYSDEDHVDAMRSMYGNRRSTLLPYLREAGFGDIYAEGGFYVWAEVPDGLDSVETTKLLLEEAGINTTPGSALGQNPEYGNNFIRFALIQDAGLTEEAGERLVELELASKATTGV